MSNVTGEERGRSESWLVDQIASQMGGRVVASSIGADDGVIYAAVELPDGSVIASASVLVRAVENGKEVMSVEVKSEDDMPDERRCPADILSYLTSSSHDGDVYSWRNQCRFHNRFMSELRPAIVAAGNQAASDFREHEGKIVLARRLWVEATEDYLDLAQEPAVVRILPLSENDMDDMISWGWFERELIPSYKVELVEPNSILDRYDVSGGLTLSGPSRSIEADFVARENDFVVAPDEIQSRHGSGAQKLG